MPCKPEGCVLWSNEHCMPLVKHYCLCESVLESFLMVAVGWFLKFFCLFWNRHECVQHLVTIHAEGGFLFPGRSTMFAWPNWDLVFDFYRLRYELSLLLTSACWYPPILLITVSGMTHHIARLSSAFFGQLSWLFAELKSIWWPLKLYDFFPHQHRYHPELFYWYVSFFHSQFNVYAI